MDIPIGRIIRAEHQKLIQDTARSDTVIASLIVADELRRGTAEISGMLERILHQLKRMEK